MGGFTVHFSLKQKYNIFVLVWNLLVLDITNELISSSLTLFYWNYCGLATPYDDIDIGQIGWGNGLRQTAPSHYLNQCWLIINEALSHSPEGNFTGNPEYFYSWYEFENWSFKIAEMRMSLRGKIRLKTALPYLQNSIGHPLGALWEKRRRNYYSNVTWASRLRIIDPLWWKAIGHQWIPIASRQQYESFSMYWEFITLTKVRAGYITPN